jgi:hypothetical protein
MRVPHREDSASHSGPEPHGSCGNPMADAWVDSGGKRRRGIELRNHFFWVPTLLLDGEGNIDHSVISEVWENLAESEHLGMRGYFMRGNREVHASRRNPTFIAGIGESSRQKTPGVSKVTTLRCKYKARKQSLNVGWVGEGEMPYVRLIKPPEVGHNIVPKKRANKRKYRPQRIPWREGRD